jgi:hypothetical protein
MLVLNWLAFADLLGHDLGLRRTPPKHVSETDVARPASPRNKHGPDGEHHPSVDPLGPRHFGHSFIQSNIVDPRYETNSFDTIVYSDPNFRFVIENSDQVGGATRSSSVKSPCCIPSLLPLAWLTRRTVA